MLAPRPQTEEKKRNSFWLHFCVRNENSKPKSIKSIVRKHDKRIKIYFQPESEQKLRKRRLMNELNSSFHFGIAKFVCFLVVANIFGPLAYCLTKGMRLIIIKLRFDGVQRRFS